MTWSHSNLYAALRNNHGIVCRELCGILYERLVMERITMFRVPSIATAIALIASPALAAAPCKDAKGKFVKCPPAAAAAAAATGGVVKDKAGKCHIASGPKKGQFTKCP